jgi:hypothetical protein
MKTSMLSLLVGCLVLPQLLAAPTNSIPRLAGIVHLPDRRVVILESVPARLGNARPLILSEGQREGDVEVLQIDSEKGTAKLRTGRTNVVLNFNLVKQPNFSGSTSFAIMLDNADLDPILTIYSELKGRTLLRSPRLPAISLSLNGSSTNHAQTALMLEKVFAEKGIKTIPDGEKFVMIVPESEAKAVHPHSPEIKTHDVAGERAELIPPGTLTFLGATVNQVGPIYAELLGRKPESNPRSTLPNGAIYFQNLTPLSKEECVYALDTLFRWQGVKVIPVGQGLVRLVPLSAPAPGRDK